MRGTMRDRAVDAARRVTNDHATAERATLANELLAAQQVIRRRLDDADLELPGMARVGDREYRADVQGLELWVTLPAVTAGTRAEQLADAAILECRAVDGMSVPFDARAVADLAELGRVVERMTGVRLR